MKGSVSAGTYLEIISYIAQQKTIRAPEILERFKLSYNCTRLLMELLEKNGVVSPPCRGCREVIAHYGGSFVESQRHRLLDDIHPN